MSAQQLQGSGLTRASISRWTRAHRLHRIYPGVYALGHSALSLDGRLIAALLYGGDEAVLSHTTAAWAWRLVDTEPARLHITVPGRCRSLPEVRAHHSRQIDRSERGDLPVTSVARTLLDLASIVSQRQLRRALAEADYRGFLEPTEVDSVLGKGRPGSRALRAALDRHLPELARTSSELEERFLEVCESSGLPLPEVNARIGLMRVDALWRAKQLAVELDGGPAHGSASAMKRDRQRELALRSSGFEVVRYSWDQIVGSPRDVVADLRRLLGI